MALRFLYGEPTRMPWPDSNVGYHSYKPSPSRSLSTPAACQRAETKSGLRRRNGPAPDRGSKAWVFPKYPAGCTTLPAVSTEATSTITTPLGTHSALTVGQRNQGRSAFEEYPSTTCYKCCKSVNKFKVYATTINQDTQAECIVIFELADNNEHLSIRGEPTRTGDPLVKMVMPVLERVLVTSHPHFFHPSKNAAYCVDCLLENPVFTDLSQRMMRELEGRAHLVRIPNGPKKLSPPALRGPHYSKSRTPPSSRGGAQTARPIRRAPCWRMDDISQCFMKGKLGVRDGVPSPYVRTPRCT